MTATVYELIGFALVRLAAESDKLDKVMGNAESNRPFGALEISPIEDRNIRDIRARIISTNRTLGQLISAVDAHNWPDAEMHREELIKAIQRWKGAPGWRKEWEL